MNPVESDSIAWFDKWFNCIALYTNGLISLLYMTNGIWLVARRSLSKVFLSRQKPEHKAQQCLLNNKGFHHRLLTDPMVMFSLLFLLLGVI